MKLDPIKPNEKIEKLIAKKITNWFYENFFKGCFEILKNNTVENAQDILRQAITSGLIFYQDGAFYSSKGRFSNAISKELEKIGAKYSKYRKAYLINAKNLDIEILWAIETTKAKTSAVALAIKAYLTKQLGNITQLQKDFVIDGIVERMLFDLQERVNKSIKAKKIEIIAPKIDDFKAREIAKKYTNNLDFFIKDWANENIPKMREVVGQMAISGKSQKDIADYIYNNYEVKTKDKAMFLARNETGLATTSYLEAKYKQEGFTSFIWKTNLDGRERKLHKELNGKKFRFDDPPIIYKNEKTGQEQRGLPGQTYNCRCSMIPYYDKEFLQNRKEKK